MKWLQTPVLWLRSTIATRKYPERLTDEQRLRAVNLITRLGESYGWNMSPSPPRKFTREILPSVPRTRGIYRFYEGEKLTYIGVSGNLCRRLYQRWDESRGDNPPNGKLAESIRSGRASVEWYITPMAGWMEDYELTEYCAQHAGKPPEFNSTCRGGKVWHLDW